MSKCFRLKAHNWWFSVGRAIINFTTRSSITLALSFIMKAHVRIGGTTMLKAANHTLRILLELEGLNVTEYFSA